METVKEKLIEEYFVIRDKNTGMYFRGKGANRWGKYYNQATIYRVKGTAEHTLKDIAWNGEQAEIVPIQIIENGATIREWASVDEPPVARPLEEWHEDYGDVLWWKFPIEEPPYVGSPLCSDWPEYHTHWTPLPPCPEPPKGAQ